LKRRDSDEVLVLSSYNTLTTDREGLV